MRRDHYHVTPSERKKAWAAHERAKARKHTHVCEWCPADDIYTCTKSPCQHLKKKPCPTHKWNAKKGIAPERLEFAPPLDEPVKKYPIIMVDMTAVEKLVTGNVKMIEATIEDADEYADYAKYEDFL